MMGREQEQREQLFYTFRLEGHVPPDHLLRQIDAVLDLSAIRRAMQPYYSSTGRPSVDPELMIRMLLIGYAFGIRSGRRLCSEVHLNLAYRWFCRLGLEGAVPDHSTFSKNRHGRLRESNLFRLLFEDVVRLCLQFELVGGEGFAITVSCAHGRILWLRSRKVLIGVGPCPSHCNRTELHGYCRERKTQGVKHAFGDLAGENARVP